MSDTVVPAPRHSTWRLVAWIALPLLVLAAAIAWIVAADPLRGFNNGAPPVEAITFERTVLDDSGISVLIRAGGSEPMTIAQVQVDDAYWQFTTDPAGPLQRGATAWISVPYPWVLGEAHRVNLVTNTGATFEHEVAVAVPTPVATPGMLLPQAIVGLIVGVLPVAIGLMFYPALRNASRGVMDFVLALTIGLLAFLLVDMTFEALELAVESAALFQGQAMVILAALATFLILMGIGRRSGTPAGLALAFYIALGIGLHNFGEGLAIGAAFAAGSAGLGTFLVLGFAIHNVTEGIG
ncbi:metal transporter, partial [Devosia sp. 66-22]|uniref:metal transporter n=1 Tax=Devosia sp. 66-22 TaxID=1895753 RepID=UPI002616F5DF